MCVCPSNPSLDVTYKKEDYRHTHTVIGTCMDSFCRYHLVWLSLPFILLLHFCLHCTANGETEADESLCKIIDNSCHGDALVGRPHTPQARKRRERERCMLSLESRLIEILWESNGIKQHICFVTVTVVPVKSLEMSGQSCFCEVCPKHFNFQDFRNSD